MQQHLVVCIFDAPFVNQMSASSEQISDAVAGGPLASRRQIRFGVRDKFLVIVIC